MNLQFLKYFVALADTRNFTKAAEKVFVVQSTFSAGIKKLEENLNTQLFYRDKRNVRLTENGQYLLPEAKKLLAQWNKIESEFSSCESKKLRIGMTKDMITDALVPHLKAFQELSGHYRVNLQEGDIPGLLKKLEKNELDGILISDTPIDEDLFDFRFAYEEELYIVVPKNHPLAVKDRLELSALDGLPFIERKNCFLFNEVGQAFEERNIKISSVFEAHSNDMVMALISSGVGISLMSKSSQEAENLKFIPIADAEFKHTMILVWNKNNITKAMENFLAV